MLEIVVHNSRRLVGASEVHYRNGRFNLITAMVWFGRHADNHIHPARHSLFH